MVNIENTYKQVNEKFRLVQTCRHQKLSLKLIAFEQALIIRGSLHKFRGLEHTLPPEVLGACLPFTLDRRGVGGYD